jgi:hypothetical protein
MFCETGIQQSLELNSLQDYKKMSKIEVKNKSGETHCHENECCGSSEIEGFEIHPI